jgi:single-strand DNA-binding protein
MSVNKVILVGNVGKDPEVRYVEKDVPVANFTLATTERGFKRQDGSEVPDRTEWHNIVVWRGLAKLTESYIRKGTSLYVEGKLRSRSWVDQNNVTRYITEIVADDLQLLGKKAEGGVPPLSSVTHSVNAPQPAGEVPPVADSKDDLPF